MSNDIYVNVVPSDDKCVLQLESNGRNISDFSISLENAEVLSQELSKYVNTHRKSKISSVSALFTIELDYIKSDEIRELVKGVLDELPLDPFLYKGASSSGKYHPIECRGLGGLTTHTKYAVQAGLVLLDQDEKLDNVDDPDLIIGALLLHDGFKYGLTGSDQHTNPDHPELIADYLAQKSKDSESGSSTQYYLYRLSELTRSHHGKWGNYPTNTRAKEYVHIADMIASRADKIRFDIA